MSAPDPAGVFASDAHRRVMANLPNPDDDALQPLELLVVRIAKDDHFEIEEEELVDVLQDLQAEGLAELDDSGWKNTELGFDVLTSRESA